MDGVTLGFGPSGRKEPARRTEVNELEHEGAGHPQRWKAALENGSKRNTSGEARSEGQRGEADGGGGRSVGWVLLRPSRAGGVGSALLTEPGTWIKWVKREKTEQICKWG